MVQKTKKSLKAYQLLLIGFGLMLFGTYIIGPPLGGIFNLAGFFLWGVVIVQAIKKYINAGS